jgi:predicted alpha/beta superfamily hydrolase
MKRLIFIFLFCIPTVTLSAKDMITIRLKIDSGKNYTDFYFASNLNGWNPSVGEYKFQKSTEGYELTIALPSTEIISYKITRGSWETVECTGTGGELPNRIIQANKIKNDTLIVLEVNHWKDEFANVPRLSTASKNVKIISDKFPLTKLGKTRRVWIYLPSEYTYTKKKYPVLYMHDGQNLFDELTAPFGEWGIDECLDTLCSELNFNIIVVGIDNGKEDRLSEYSPYDFKVKPDEVNTWDVKGTGDNYLSSLVYDLKPYIDSAYRTKPDSKNTHIGGSSMGGLISLYAIMRYPDVFGTAGVFSPAFWTNMDSLKAEIIRNKNAVWKGNVYMIAGELEGRRYTSNMTEISEMIERKGKKEVIARKISMGQHKESFWRSMFPDYLRWLSSSNY